MRLLISGVVVLALVLHAVGQPPPGVSTDVLQEATINPSDLERMLEAAPDDPAFRGRILMQIADYHLTARSLVDYNAAVERILANWPDPPNDSVAALGQAVRLRQQMTTALAAFSKGGPDPRLTANDHATVKFAADLASTFSPRKDEWHKAVSILETLGELFKTQRRGYAERAVVKRLYDLHPDMDARKPYLMRLSHLSMMYFRDTETSGTLMEEWAEHQTDAEQKAIFQHAAAVCWYLLEDFGKARALLDRLSIEAPAAIQPRVGVTDVQVKIRTADFDAALDAINDRIAEGQIIEIESHLMALRAYVYALQGDRAAAVEAFNALLQAHRSSRFAGTVRRILHALTEEPPEPVATPAPSSALPNIVMISLDTVRPDFLGCYGGAETPAIDALAAAGTVFENAYSTSSWTKAAHGSVFTGLQPYAHGAMGHRDALAAGTTLLQENLRDAGYTTAGVVSAPPIHRLYGFARGFDVYDDFTYDLDRTANLFSHGNDARVQIHSGRTGSLITDAAFQALRQVRQSGHPFLLFVNYFDAHHNYVPHMPYSLEASRDYYGYHWGDVDELQMSNMEFEGMRPFVEVDRLRALYAAEVRMVDDEVARLVVHLEKTGAYDNTIFVLFADHGEEFLEHGFLTHGKSLYEEVLRIPLILAGPGIEAGARMTTPVSLTDIAPTLIELAGAPKLRDADVPTLLAPEIERTIHAQLDLPGYRLESILRDDRKLIRDRENAKKMLFDLGADRAEANDLSNDRANRVAEMTVELDRIVTETRMLGHRLSGGAGTEARGPAASLDALEEQLRAMGYLSGEKQTQAEPPPPAGSAEDIVLVDFYEQPVGTFTAILKNTGDYDTAVLPTSVSVPGHGAPVHSWWIDYQPSVLAPGGQGVLRFTLKRPKNAPDAFELALDGRDTPLPLVLSPESWLPRYGVDDAGGGVLHLFIDNPTDASIFIENIQLDGSPLEDVSPKSLVPGETAHILAQTDDTIVSGYKQAVLSIAGTARAINLYDTKTPRFEWEENRSDVFKCPTHKHGPFDQAAQTLMTFVDKTSDRVPEVHFCRNRLPAGLAAFAPLAPRLRINPVAVNLERGTADAWRGYGAALDLIESRTAQSVWTMMLDDTAPTEGAYGVPVAPNDPVITLEDARAVAYLALAAGAKGVVARAREGSPKGQAVLETLLDELKPLTAFLATGVPADNLVQEFPADDFVVRVLQQGFQNSLVVAVRTSPSDAPLRLRLDPPEGRAFQQLSPLPPSDRDRAPEFDAERGIVDVPEAGRVEAFLLSAQ